MDQHWLTIIIVVVLIAGIIFDGVRRMRKARLDSLHMKLKPTKKKNQEKSKQKDKHEKGYGSEFPNGGARVSSRTIDPDRIKEVRNKYNFGSDMSTWRERVVEKIAEHRGKLQHQDDDHLPEKRIEPSFEPDPLMDNIISRDEHDVDAYADYSASEYSDSGEDDDDALDRSHDESFDYELYDKADEALEDYVANNKESSVNNDNESNEVSHIKVGDNKASTNKVGGNDSQIEKPQINKVSLAAPIQVSLNLDDSVPMLMDTFDDIEPDTAPVKKSLNPFSKQPQPKRSPDSGAYNSGYKSQSQKEPYIADKSSQASAVSKESSPTASIPAEVLVIHVRAAGDNVFYGNELLEVILEHGLRYGAMDIFHRHSGEDGEGPILFSLSNMVKPGIFDLHTFDEFSTVGVSLFLALPVEIGNYMEAFEAMLATAKAIAQNLHGDLKDENRSVLTGQTIEHYRERIRDFSRRQRLEKRKL